MSKAPLRAEVPRSFQLLAIAASALLLAAAIFVTLDRRLDERIDARHGALAALQVHAQRIALNAERAAAGEAQAHELLADSAHRVENALDRLGKALDDAADPNAGTEAALSARWQELSPHVQRVLDQRAASVALPPQEQTVLETGERLETLLPRLVEAAKAQALAPAAAAQLRQLQTSMEALRAGAAAAIAGTDAFRALQEHAAAALDAVRMLAGEQPGSALQAAADALHETLLPHVLALERLAEVKPAAAEARAAARRAARAADLLNEEAARVAAPYVEGGRDSRYIWAAFAAAGLAFVCLLWIGKTVLDDAERRAAENLQEATRNRLANEHAQHAIQRLVDQMSALAQGDLTVRASVNDELTGALANAMNHAVGELRRLVADVNRAASQLAEGCARAQTIGGELLNAAQRHQQETTATGAAVDAVTASVLQVAHRAAQCARVAEASLHAAAEGSDCARRALAGMDALREQIQDTTRRMKRLGESAQEAGEIADVMGDITERTQMLALNAALQTHTAGGSGRGLEQVADEIQRLAARSAQAARQVEHAVRAIQADTRDAAAAMERSTGLVVEQTSLAGAAGEALGRIEAVARELAGHVDDISQATKVQRDAAERIRAAMNAMTTLAGLATGAARASADQGAELARLAQALDRSVAGLRLV
ncbi:MAG TPA: methyl-accepting chemotaxis protein [Myxococcota bacterium]